MGGVDPQCLNGREWGELWKKLTHVLLLPPRGPFGQAAFPKNYKPTQNNQDAAFKAFLAFLTFNYPPGASDLDSALTIIEDMVFIDMFHEFTFFIIFEQKTRKKAPLAVDTIRTYLGNVKVRLESTPLKTNFGQYTLDPKDPQPVCWYQFTRSSNGEHQRWWWVVEDGEEPTDDVRMTAARSEREPSGQQQPV